MEAGPVQTPAGVGMSHASYTPEVILALSKEEIFMKWAGKWDVIIWYKDKDSDMEHLQKKVSRMFNAFGESTHVQAKKIGMVPSKAPGMLRAKPPVRDEWGEIMLSEVKSKGSAKKAKTRAALLRKTGRGSLAPEADLEVGDGDGGSSMENTDDAGAEGQNMDKYKRRVAKRNKLILRMKKCGLIVVKQRSANGRDVMLKITAPTDLLAHHAETMGLNMPLKGVAEKTVGRQAKGLADKLAQRLYGRRPLRMGYAPFKVGMEDFFHGDEARFFRSLDRQRIIFRILETPRWGGGCGIDLNREVSLGTFKDYYGLHSGTGTNRLKDEWLNNDVTDLRQPREAICDYFGPKITFYFEYLRYYTKRLISLAMVGLATMIYAWSQHSFKLNNAGDAGGFAPAIDLDNIVVCLFALYMCLWSSWFIEKWKRKQNSLAFQFNLVDIRRNTTERPEFSGTAVKGKVTEHGLILYEEMGLTEEDLDKIDEIVLWYPPLNRLMLQCLGAPVLFTFAMSVFVGTLAIFVFKRAMDNRGSYEGSLVGSFINAVFIMIMNVVYQKVAIILNNFENHRTDIEYEDALITKTFVFQFVNSYISLFFIAFLKNPPIPDWAKEYPEGGAIPSDLLPSEMTPKSLGQTATNAEYGTINLDIGYCTQNSCMLDLFFQLAILLVAKQFVSNFQEVTLPWLKGKIISRRQVRQAKTLQKRLVKDKIAKEKDAGLIRTNTNAAKLEKMASSKATLPYFELQASMPKPQGTFAEYNELMIQFGYMTVNVSASSQDVRARH